MTTSPTAEGVRIVEEADTMRPHENPEDILERHDDTDIVNKLISRLAKVIKRCKSVTVLTGAGISTSIGIPDYRGPNGKWTLVQQLQTETDPSVRAELTDRIAALTAAYLAQVVTATPSVAHLGLVALVRAGYVKHVITTNTDALHRKSGLAPHEVSELHGSSTKARCDVCAKYAYSEGLLRRTDTDPSTFGDGASHKLPVACFLTPGCRGTLHDTIVHFGELLHPEVQQAADEATADVDCLITLGTSLRIISCNALMDIGTNQGCFAIVNLQPTEYDHLAKVRVFHECDTFVRLLCDKLGVEIPSFRPRRCVEIEWRAGVMSVGLCDEAGAPFARDCDVQIIAEDGQPTAVRRFQRFDIELAESTGEHPWHRCEWPCNAPTSVLLTFSGDEGLPRVPWEIDVTELVQEPHAWLRIFAGEFRDGQWRLFSCSKRLVVDSR